MVTAETLTIHLEDGRTVSAPIGGYPRLANATAAERSRWHIVGKGSGVHWPDLDEDVSVRGLLAGAVSCESQASLDGWLAKRKVAG